MRQPPIIQWAGPDCAEDIVALNQRLGEEAAFYLSYDVDPATGAEMLRARLDPERAALTGEGVLVARYNDDEIAGMAMLRAHRHPAFDGVLQLGLGVAPDARRRGVGRALIAAALDGAAIAGARRLQLAVVAANAAALSLFEASGFEREGVLVGAAAIDGAIFDVIPMARAPERLPPAI